MVVYIQRMLEKMKDKNGFTLPEVLTVITIMSVIIILTTSIAVRMLDQTKKKISDMDEKSLIESARVYGEDLDKNNKTLLDILSVKDTERIEYIRTDAFIEKALAYLNSKFYFHNAFYGIVSTDFSAMEELFEDFENYMREE